MTNDANEKIEIEVGEKGGKVALSGSGTSRLINAAADFISPVTQPLGAIGDFVRQFRLYREVTAAIVLEQTAERLRERGASPTSIPLKVLIPALEKSSLEDPENEEMIERWSELLASAAVKGEGSDRAILVDILSRMSAKDASLLDDIAMRPVVNIGAFSQIEDSPLNRRYDSSRATIMSFHGKNWHRLCAQLVIRAETRGSALATLHVWDGEDFKEVFYYSRKARGYSDLDVILDRLKVLGLIELVEERVSIRERYDVTFATVYLTHVGVEFFYSTHDPELRKIPADRSSSADHSDDDCLHANGETFHSGSVLRDVLKSGSFTVGANHPILSE